jgi:membrane dipeptidase
MKINSGHSRRDFLATIGTLSAGMTLIPLCAGATDEIDPNVASIVSGTMGIDTHNHIDVPLAAAEVPGPDLSIINSIINITGIP